ncbi:helix-turn-helix domain-containing protein [Penicillium verhagenii]|uniref:helix-turn-helix domain-containing protein n=1 Tax=Penicillium verhagenii TaxID=1562060 RepID=UPI0025453AFA|nr:helix-turn-helix domain-containing protein [Penicillium verhagenii]KAJ5935238.1 helix-turn-helix domain-containing protein [Penicillium verhagenii]
MSYSLYDTSVLPAKNALTALAAILRKGEEHSNGANLITATLHDDMKPLSFQVFVAVSLVEKMVARLTGGPVPESTDDISSFADAQAFIEKGLKALNDADKTTINNNAEKLVEVGMGPGVNIPMRADNYASAFSIPNVYFHVVTAYSILRKEGVPLGKGDYLGTFMGPYLPQKQ